MTSARKLNVVRQMSLQCDTTKLNTRSLRKQQSQEDRVTNMQLANNLADDESDDAEDHENQNIVRISVSAKTGNAIRNPKTERPAVKLAWTDSGQKCEDPTKKDDGVVAKKCKEMRRPFTIKKQTSLDKDSILCNNRQNLTERLRQAWVEKAKCDSKQNLDIFLNSHKHNDRAEVDDRYRPNRTETDCDAIESNERPDAKPKLIEPLGKVDENNVKDIFQKQIRRNNFRNRSTTIDFPYTPSRSVDRVRENTIVVVPVIDHEPSSARTNVDERPRVDHDQPSAKNDHEQPINVVIRPSTASAAAATRRTLFQRRTNSAFHETAKKDVPTIVRPPLVRASSVPAKSQRSKFPVTKRRTKSGVPGKKREGKNEAIPRGHDDGEDVREAGNGDKKKFVQRCISTVVSGTEIETMVSLVSPDGSDNEEIPEPEKISVVQSSPVKTNLIRKDERAENGGNNKNFSLRKTVKSVSFQQSSIHAVRSFSASFPARRGSVAAAFMIGNVQKDKENDDGPSNNLQKQQQTRLTSSTSFDENNRERGPKRRLLRTKSVPIAINPPFINDPLDEIVERKSEENISSLTVTIKKSVIIENQSTIKNESKSSSSTSTGTTATTAIDDNSQPDFLNAKEKQCWETYCKMSEKGVNITFDTILRGMLTPTEYRMRKKVEVQAEEDAENVDGSVKK